MEEAERRGIYRKDLEMEAFFEKFNDCIVGLERRFENFSNPEASRPIFIVGPPRSGSTLLSQVLVSAGFGYISNFVARFWRSPAAGVYFQKSLGLPNSKQRSTFSSDYGVTEGWFEPHEFGYYWDRWFDMGQDTHTMDEALRARVDTQGLRRSIAAICTQFERPVVFKNTTWCSTQADMLASYLPQSVFVFITRDVPSTAFSILKARRERYGSDHVWWSNRPSTYRELTTKVPAVQVVSQVMDLLVETERSLSKVPRERVVRLTYEDLCRDPRGAVRMTGSAVGLSQEMDLAEIPSVFENMSKEEPTDSDLLLIEKAWRTIRQSTR
jgi:LPS sulfotransferase NodH